MNRGRGVLIFFMNVAGIIVVTVLLAPLAMLLVDFLSPLIPSLPRLLEAPKYPEGYNFAPVWRIVSQIVIMVFLFINVWRMRLTSLRSLGLSFQPGWRLLLWRGFFWGLVGYMIIVGVSLLVEARHFQMDYSGWPLLGKLFHMFVIGTVAGIWKEIVFRGMMFQVIQRWIETTGSVLVTSVVFGTYLLEVGAQVPVKSGAIDWGVGIRGLQEHVWALLSSGEKVLPVFVGFFLMGVVLNYSFVWTGSLYFPIGLHAAWNFCEKSDRFFLDRALRGWLFGPEGMGPALFVWAGLLLFLLYVALRYRSDLFRGARSSA